MNAEELWTAMSSEGGSADAVKAWLSGSWDDMAFLSGRDMGLLGGRILFDPECTAWIDVGDGTVCDSAGRTIGMSPEWRTACLEVMEEEFALCLEESR